MTKVIASILASSTEEMIRAIRECTDGADIVELRVDAVPAPDLERLRAEDDKPLILTCRSRTEGGCFRGTETERLSILGRALELDYDYVDIEMAAWKPDLARKTSRSKLILSRHFFDKFPKNLTRTVHQGVDMGADLVKLAAKVCSLADGLRLCDAGSVAKQRGVGYLPVAMGPTGIATRILSPRLGLEFTYASARGHPATGPGQIDLEELLTIYRFRSLGLETRIFGLLGCPASGSLSPAMHNAVFEHFGTDTVYVPFEESRLGPFMAAARKMEIAGLSVTRPHKEAILGYLDEVDERARRVGAVNTVSVRNGRWKGHNTDVGGVLEPIAKRTTIEGKLAVVLGAGGAARAAAWGLAEEGARVAIVSRRPEQARNLAEELGAESGTLDRIDNWEWDILINATPVGGSDSRGELPAHFSRVKPGSVVLDMVYAPERTALMEKMHESGAEVISGLEMLVAQAVRQVEIWMGRRPHQDILIAAARSGAGRRD
jgi:3-dehydroquinate dehydratase/shikimate dehydrogenase